MTELLPCPSCGGEAKIFKGVQLYWGSKYTEAEAIAVWNTRAERTCRNVDDHKEIWFICSECNWMQTKPWPNYCPNCGAKVVE